MHVRSRLSAVLGSALLLLLGTVGVASAAPGEKPGGGGGKPEVVESCSVLLAPAPGPMQTSEVLGSDCAGVSGTGRMSLAAASVLLAVEYTGAGYTGSARYFYGTTSCYGGEFGFSSLGSWSNIISSSATYNGCVGRHYDGTGYTGSNIHCGCSNMYYMDNRTSSIYFY